MTVSALKGHCTIHAEVSAVKSCRGSVEGATIYVARVNNAGVPRMSKPCNECRGILAYAGVKRVVWTENG